MLSLFKEIGRVFWLNPIKISLVGTLDILEAVIASFVPLIIGYAIDGLIASELLWLWALIALEIIYWLSHTVNKYIDTRVYSKIIEYESNKYYLEAFEQGLHSSIISSRLELVKDVPYFLEFSILNILRTIFGIIIALIYLINIASWKIFVIAVLMTILIPIITYKWQSDIAKDNEKYKDEDEKRVDSIESGSFHNFSRHTRKIAQINISISDLDSKSYFVTAFLQIGLLLLTILSITFSQNISAGVLYATISYVYNLNENTLDINDHILDVKNVILSIQRLHESDEIAKQGEAKND